MYQCKDGPRVLVHLPAIITAVWSDTCVNLQVFTDGTNSDEQNMSPMKWVTSATLDGAAVQPRTWHWPEREDEKPAAQTISEAGGIDDKVGNWMSPRETVSS